MTAAAATSIGAATTALVKDPKLQSLNFNGLRTNTCYSSTYSPLLDKRIHPFSSSTSRPVIRAVSTDSKMMRNLQPLQCPLLRHHRFLEFGFGFYKRCDPNKMGYNSLLKNKAVDGDSEFEIDPDKARDALRKLDQQLDLISKKQVNPVPKVKASSPYDARDEVTKDVQDPGSFLPIAFFGLLVFTIVYNIFFIKVIKPSIDGPQGELAPVRSSIMRQVLKDE